mmetsp:Transcript_15322/g.43439  ORF Transcript_15322/g.43439 Transcript_15322/m.43439 type:complete len:204 (+) Transcript_15322:106-717(+)
MRFCSIRYTTELYAFVPSALPAYSLPSPPSWAMACFSSSFLSFSSVPVPYGPSSWYTFICSSLTSSVSAANDSLGPRPAAFFFGPSSSPGGALVTCAPPPPVSAPPMSSRATASALAGMTMTSRTSTRPCGSSFTSPWGEMAAPGRKACGKSPRCCSTAILACMSSSQSSGLPTGRCSMSEPCRLCESTNPYWNSSSSLLFCP